MSDEFTLMIDYAHNAMSLESLLETLKEYHPHRLVCLFGSAETAPDCAALRWGGFGQTGGSDHYHFRQSPFEDPMDIIADIREGMKKTDGKYVEIPDRKEAIAYAIHHGEPGDIIVLAGKGHENYQEIKGKKYPMDERDLIRDILEGK